MTGTGPLIRPMTPADRPALANFPNRVSAGSANFRFHGSLTMLTDKTLDLLLDLADGQREAITALDDCGIAGVAWFARDDLDPATAEVAILVADEWHHRGLARQLLRPLAERARSAGIERFRAEIQAGQHRRAALLPRIDTDRARAAQERRRGRAHQRGGTTSPAGLRFARPRPDVRNTNLGRGRGHARRMQPRQSAPAYAISRRDDGWPWLRAGFRR